MMTLPAIAAPMFLISTPQMVIESCKEGIIGTFPALTARTNKVVDKWMTEIKEELADYIYRYPYSKVSTWGVDFIAQRSIKRYTEDLEMIRKHQPPIVITPLGDSGVVVEVVH